MSLSPQLIEGIARELLGRQFEDEVLQQVCERLSGLLERVRSLDEVRLHDLNPAAVFPVGHPALAQARPGRPAWADLTSTPGSSGYAASTVRPEPTSFPGLTVSAPATGAPASDLLFLSASEAALRVRRRELSPVDLVAAVLERIEALQPVLNSFITVLRDSALEQARAAERAVAHGDDLGPLHGVPLAVKDCFLTAGIRTTGGSRHLAQYVPECDAAVVAHLKAAGAILVGKTHTPEWFYDATCSNIHFGPARNPWDPERIPGGSSGGSAAAVAAGMSPIALGSDGGGSVRIPAAACGVVGFKPTFGRVSKAGSLMLTWSFDTVGFLTRTVADAALLTSLTAGADPRDPSAVPAHADDYLTAVGAGSEGLHGVRIGLDRRWFEDQVEPEVTRACLGAVEVLAEMGADVREVQLPSPNQMLLVHRLIALPEVGTYHAPYLRAQPGWYSEDVRLRLELGQFMLARDYLNGQRLRGELCQSIAALMDEVDVLVLPTLTMRAPHVGAETVDVGDTTDVIKEALIRLTAPFNVTGQPAISLPCGLPSGLPVGLQIVGRPLEDATVLRVAAAYEAATKWHCQRPPV